MVMGQTIVLSEIKTQVPLENDPANQNFLLQRYEERIKSLSQTDRVSKFCMDAGLAGSSPGIVPIERRNWIDIEPKKYSLSPIMKYRSNVSSSYFTTCASRRRRSVSVLANEGKSSESTPTIDSLV